MTSIKSDQRIKSDYLFACWGTNGRMIHAGKGILELQKRGVIRNLNFSDRFISQLWSKDIFKKFSTTSEPSEWSGNISFRYKGVDYSYRVLMILAQDQIATTAIDVSQEVLRDSEYKKMEARIKDLVDLFADFIDHSESSVVVIDNEFRIVSANRSFQALSRLKTIEGQFLFSIPLELITSEKTLAAIRKVVRSGGETVLSLQLKKAINGYRNVFIRVFRADHVTVILITFGYPLEMMDQPMRVSQTIEKGKETVVENSNFIQSLTKQEVRVLSWVAKGFTSANIGQKLGISPRTVDTHRRNIMKKLGVNHVQGLTMVAIKNGIV